MKPDTRLLAAVTLVAVVAGAETAAAVPSGTMLLESPVVQVFPVPANLVPAAAMTTGATGASGATGSTGSTGSTGTPGTSGTTGLVLDPAIAPSPDGVGENFVVSAVGAKSVLLEATADGTITAPQPGENLGSSAFSAIVPSAGFDWALSNDGLYAIGADGSAQAFSLPSGAYTDMAADVVGNLYLAKSGNAIVRCAVTPGPMATCSPPDAVKQGAGGASFVSGQPEALAGTGAGVFFTTVGNDLGSMSADGASGGSYAQSNVQTPDSTEQNTPVIGPASPFPHSLTLGIDGRLYGIGSAVVVPIDITVPPGLDGKPDTIVAFTADTGHVDSNPKAVGYFNEGLPDGVVLSSVTTGPDGEIWFTIEGTGGPAIGELDPSTGAIASYPLPAGYTLPGAGADVIERGPPGSGTVWFAARSTGAPSQPAIGEISGLLPTPAATGQAGISGPTGASGPTGVTATSPTGPTGATSPVTMPPPTLAPGSLAIEKAAQVAGGAARIRVSCTGAVGATCRGTLTLTTTATKTSKRGSVRGRREGRKSPSTIASGPVAYALGVSTSSSISVRLSHQALALLATAKHHTLSVRATAVPDVGQYTIVTVSLSTHSKAARRSAARSRSRPERNA